MRDFPTEIINRLKNNQSFLCKAWEFKRLDGYIVYLTEHDEDIIIGTKIYKSIIPIDSGNIETSFGFAPDRASISGVFNIAAFKEAEILLGLWDNAEISLSIIDWQTKTEIANIWNGYINNINTNNVGFEFELVGIEYKLNKIITNKYTRHCSANFGDNKCGKNVNSLSINIDSIENDLVIFTINQNLENYKNGEIAFYYDGILTPKIKIKSIEVKQNIASLKLEKSLGFAPIITNGIIYEGCDKSIENCKAYNNFANFRGFPYMPGEGAIYKGPK